jgi:predicted house-cleaning noncanonical NTP pyrophosphatase (MazG superfamily)
MTFNKLVRDKIPEIIADSGQKASFRVLDESEMMSFLEKKLDEEVAEFHESKTLDELADIVEVLFAIAESLGHSAFELGSRRRRKLFERGGFSKRICLIETEEQRSNHD